MKTGLLILMTLGLASCGFHLRDTNAFQHRFGKLSISANNDQIKRALSNQLNAHDCRKHQCAYHLTVEQQPVITHTASATTQIATSESYTVSAKVALSWNNKPVSHTTVTAHTSALFSNTQTTNTSIIGNATPAQNQISHELAERIYHWLLSKTVTQNIKAAKNEN